MSRAHAHDDEARRQIVFHDLRHTGMTWRAVRGDDPLKIQRAAGHDDLRTTQRYINEAEVFDQIFTIPGSTQLLTQGPYVDEFRTALTELAA